MINNKDDALALLDKLQAPAHLVTHVTLVGEAAEQLIDLCTELAVPIDAEFIRIGVVLHDVGKVIHTHEMTGPGSDHEPEGQRILLEQGVSARIARCCMSHARWNTMECCLEELLIALADKLWKGKRVEALELLVIDSIAAVKNLERWDIYEPLDSRFEAIAAEGDTRLQRSVVT